MGTISLLSRLSAYKISRATYLKFGLSGEGRKTGHILKTAGLVVVVVGFVLPAHVVMVQRVLLTNVERVIIDLADDRLLWLDSHLFAMVGWDLTTGDVLLVDEFTGDDKKLSGIAVFEVMSSAYSGCFSVLGLNLVRS